MPCFRPLADSARLHDTSKGLNRNQVQRLVCFRDDGTGRRGDVVSGDPALTPWRPPVAPSGAAPCRAPRCPQGTSVDRGPGGPHPLTGGRQYRACRPGLKKGQRPAQGSVRVLTPVGRDPGGGAPGDRGWSVRVRGLFLTPYRIPGRHRTRVPGRSGAAADPGWWCCVQRPSRPRRGAPRRRPWGSGRWGRRWPAWAG
jgi:hypothetical protein